jgi:hypothetical protein
MENSQEPQAALHRALHLNPDDQRLIVDLERFARQHDGTPEAAAADKLAGMIAAMPVSHL